MNSSKHVHSLSHWIVLLCALRPMYTLREGKFYAGVLCDLDTRMSMRCSHPVPSVKTQHVCVFECSKDPTCVGVSMDNTRTCFHHHRCPDAVGCVTREREHKYLSKNCAHDGVWNPAQSTCTCKDGWVGEHCLDLPSNCLDLGDLGRYAQGSYRTHLNLTVNTGAGDVINRFVPVLCYIKPSSGYSNIRVISNAGNGNFRYRTWHEYKHGFFVDDANNWIGLENWHAVSMAGYLEHNVYLDAGDTFWYYTDFVVNGEKSGYSFRFSGSSQASRGGSLQISFPDCLGPLQNVPFSTIDNDSDGVLQYNCADVVGSGWWFAGVCRSGCNLLGVSPKDWGTHPEDQWMRLAGMDASTISNADHVGINSYLKYIP